MFESAVSIHQLFRFNGTKNVLLEKQPKNDCNYQAAGTATRSQSKAFKVEVRRSVSSYAH